MTRLLIRPEGERAPLLLRPEDAARHSGLPWRRIGLEARRLAPGDRLTVELGGREACVVVLGGRCAVRCGAQEWEIGERRDPFDGPPAAAYLPPGPHATVEARTECDLAVGFAPAAAGPPARPLPPSGARPEVRGSGVMERRIHHILMDDQQATSLLVTEVITPAGHWSSYPPHKHDMDDPPRERALEEIYYYRFRDRRAFALQRVYAADGSLDESVAARDGDLVLVPRGYHTVSAAPGYDVYYLNVMAGPHREWRVSFDPDHERMRR